MVKGIHHITIKSFSLFEKTGQTKYLIWKNLPLGFLFKKGIRKLIDLIAKEIGSDESNEKIMNNEADRIKSENNIHLLSVLRMGIVNLIQNKIIVDIWIKEAGKKPKHDLKNLKFYTDHIRKETGLHIESVEDIKKLDDKIEFYTIKHIEIFRVESQPQGKGYTFMQIVRGVLGVLEMQIDYNMPLSDFFDFKIMAQEKVTQLQSRSNG